jgi:hypothetical protein
MISFRSKSYRLFASKISRDSYLRTSSLYYSRLMPIAERSFALSYYDYLLAGCRDKLLFLFIWLNVPCVTCCGTANWITSTGSSVLYADFNCASRCEQVGSDRSVRGSYWFLLTPSCTASSIELIAGCPVSAEKLIVPGSLWGCMIIYSILLSDWWRVECLCEEVELQYLSSLFF